MECKYDKCDNDAVGASAFCCASHRAQQSRRNITGATPKLLPTEALERLERAAKPSATSEAQQGATIAAIEELESGRGITSGNVDEFLKDSGIIAHPPCKRLDVYCHACTDEVFCVYKAEQTIALPGNADYKGVCVEVDGQWRVA